VNTKNQGEQRKLYDFYTYDLEKLSTIPLIPGPKFVYAHFLTTHRPFLFGKDGSFSPDQSIQGYIDSILYTNSAILKSVDEIIANSKTKPIIVIQGDHGIPRLDDPRQRVAILNAYRLPGDGADRLYPSISPVNSFRAIAQEYFGSEVPLLADRSFLGKRGRLSFDELAEANPECVR
jgi:hypothetical protein